MRLTVTHTGKGSAMDCVPPSGARLTFDDPDTGNHGASPVEHLLASIGACALVDVGMILAKQRLAFEDLRVECIGERRDEPFPRVFVDVKLVFRVAGDVPSDKFEKAVKLSLEKYCSVAGTLRESAPVAFEAIVG